MKKIFVFGLYEVSPGKTVVSTALCRGLSNKGLDVAPLKPRSGHNLWYQHDSYYTCIKKGRLFCEDIIKLKKASKCALPYEIINPVDALMAPLDAGFYLTNNIVRRMYLDEKNTFNNFIIERYTSCEEGSLKNTFCLNKNQYKNAFFDYDHINMLIRKADEVIEVKNLDEWASVFQSFGPDSFSKCYKSIVEENDVIIVEGFNDAVCPAPELDYDVVIGVGPGVSAIYSPTNFQKTIEVLSMTGHNSMALRSKDVLSYIKPIEKLPIKALKKKQLEDYDFLCEQLQNLLEFVLKKLEK